MSSGDAHTFDVAAGEPLVDVNQGRHALNGGKR
jgi:hypothetical protein